MCHFQQIRQSAVTTDMTEKALGKLSDGLKQALEEAQATQTEQLEQFMQNQTLELRAGTKANCSGISSKGSSGSS